MFQKILPMLRSRMAAIFATQSYTQTAQAVKTVPFTLRMANENQTWTLYEANENQAITLKVK